MKRAQSLDYRLENKSSGDSLTTPASFWKSRSYNSKAIYEEELDDGKLNDFVIGAFNKLDIEENKLKQECNLDAPDSSDRFKKYRPISEPAQEQTEIEVPLSTAAPKPEPDHELMDVTISILSVTGLKATSSMTKTQKILKNISSRSVTTSDSIKSGSEIVSAFVSFSRKADNESSIVTYMKSTKFPALDIFDTHTAKWPTTSEGNPRSVINCSLLMKKTSDKKVKGAASKPAEPIELRIGVIHGKEKVCIGCTKLNITEVMNDTEVSLPLTKLHSKVWGKDYLKKKIFGQSNSFVLEEDAKLNILLNVQSEKLCNKEDYSAVTSDLHFLEVKADYGETAREWPDEIYKSGTREEISTLSTEGCPQYLVEITTDIIRSDKIPDEVTTMTPEGPERYFIASDGSLSRSFISTQLTSTFEEKINTTADEYKSSRSFCSTRDNTSAEKSKVYPVEVMTDYVEPARLNEENEVSWILQRQESSFDEYLMKRLKINTEAYTHKYEESAGENGGICNGICKLYSTDNDYDSSTYDSSFVSGDRTHYGPLDFLCLKSSKTYDSFMTGDSTSVSWSTSAYDSHSGSSGLGTRTFTNELDEDGDSILRRYESKYSCSGESANSKYSTLLKGDNDMKVNDGETEINGKKANPITKARKKFCSFV